MMSISDMVKYVLVTQERCVHCAKVAQDFLPRYADTISTIAPFSRVHIKSAEDLNKIPEEIRSHVKAVPQLYAIYNDKTFSNINPLDIKRFSHWMGETVKTAEERSGPKMVLIILLSNNCSNCTQWKESGELKKFVDEEKEKHGDKLMIDEFVLDNIPEKKSNKVILRQAFLGFRVPYLVVIPYNVWKNPTIESIQKTFYPAISDPRSSEGKIIINRWLDNIMSDEGILYYLVLATSDGCFHCRNWKTSGGEAEFKKQFSNIDGILLIHNGMTPAAIQSKIAYVPSLFLVPREEWTKTSPKVFSGPDPRETTKVREWIDAVIKEGRWKNDKDTLPDDFRKSKPPRPRRQRIV